MSRACEIEQFKAFIEKAPPLSVFCYYIGYSMQDTVLSKTLGKLVYKEATLGKVYLHLKRCTHMDFRGQFEYLAVRASKKPRKSLIPMTNEAFCEKYAHGQSLRTGAYEPYRFMVKREDHTYERAGKD